MYFEDAIRLLRRTGAIKYNVFLRDYFNDCQPDSPLRSDETGAAGGAAGGAHITLIDSQRFVKIPASVLKTLPGLDRLDMQLFKDKTIRQIGCGHFDDKGTDISGFFVVADGGAALLFKDVANARRWANDKNKVNIEIAPSLTYIHSGNSHVSLLELTNFLISFEY